MRYWLTPVVHRAPLRLSGARISCPPSAELDSFRLLLQGAHSMLLPMFKASLLLSDEENDVCGIDNQELNWESGEDLIFDGGPFLLSHCGESFLEHLLPTKEAGSLLAGVKNAHSGDFSDGQQYWLEQMLCWLENGWQVILLREDGAKA